MSAKRKSPDEESTTVPVFAGPRSVGTSTASAASATVHVSKKAASSRSEGATARSGEYRQEDETLSVRAPGVGSAAAQIPPRECAFCFLSWLAMDLSLYSCLRLCNAMQMNSCMRC